MRDSEVMLNPNRALTVYTDIDKVYDLVEGNGRYKYIVLMLSTITFVSYMLYMVCIPFFLILPETTCNYGGSWHVCTKDEVCLHPGVLYRFTEPKEYNFVTEFDWYCDDATPSYYTSTSFFVGTLCSVVVVGTLSDTFGRIPLMIVGSFGNMLGLGLMAIFTTPHMCLFCSFLIGFFVIGNNASAFSYLADSIPEKNRDFFPSILNCQWADATIIMSIIMSAGIQWRTMCLIFLIFNATFVIPLFWVRESPKLYFSQNKMHKAELRLRNLARINGVDASYIKLAPANTTSDKTEEMTFGQRMGVMCCDSINLMNVAMITIMLVTCNTVYFVLTLNIEKMKSNPYVTAILLAISEIVATLAGGFSLNYVSPKLGIAVSFAITTVGLFGLGIWWENPALSMICCTLGKLGSASIDNLLLTVAGLICPTEILGTALGIGILATRFGGIIAKPLYLLGATPMCMILAVSTGASTLLPYLLVFKKEREEAERKKREEAEKKETEGNTKA